MSSAIDGIDGSSWDDLLHDTLPFSTDPLAHQDGLAALQAYDLELSSGVWGTQSRRVDHFPSVLGSIGSIPPFDVYSPASSESSPVLSDDCMFSPDELRRANSMVSTEGTISPRDSIFMSSEIAESMPNYFAYNSPASLQMTPGPITPMSPRPNLRATSRNTIAVKPKVDGEIPHSGPVRRRSNKVAPAAATSSNSVKVAPTSNNNNSKPMTARDRKRRQMHNASAMRSRIRLNETLDKMWKTIPVSRRRKTFPSLNQDGGDMNDQIDEIDDDEEERIGRADKVEVGIDYILYLEDRVRELEERFAGSGSAGQNR